MSCSVVPSPHRGISGAFAHGARDDAKVASIDAPTSHAHPHASWHRHDTPDPESETDEETPAQYATPDTHSAAPNRTVSRAEPIPTGLDRTVPRVRFRSRVRISAGRRRRYSDGLSDASSISGSPSSSISAPLRTHYTGSSGWGSLGTRVSNLTAPAAPRPPSRGGYANGDKGSAGGSRDGNARRQCPRSSQLFLDDDIDERTHLMTATTRPLSYVGNRYTHDPYHDNGERERWWREQLIDEVFGKWPARLLNGHWWWWNLEPIICCLCYPDEEE